MILSTSLQSICFARFLKTFIRLLPKLSATRTLRLCRSLCLRHLREIVCFHLRVLPLSVCLLYVVGLLYHSIFRKNLIYCQCGIFQKNDPYNRFLTSPQLIFILSYISCNGIVSITLYCCVSITITSNSVAISIFLFKYSHFTKKKA